MKLLLDTHIWIWAVNRPERLSRAVRTQLDRSQNEIYLSPISIWEAHHAANRGKLGMKRDFTEWLDRALLRVPLKEASFNFAVAAEVCSITLPQSDFGDVLLAATCRVFDLTLVTADTQLIECSWLKTLPN